LRNYFSTEAVAERYARARPAYHHHVIERLEEVLVDSLPFGQALDVGCGTGGSTIAIERLATTVVGIDPSLPMLRRADIGAVCAFVVGQAEKLPFQHSTFDLVTASSAFHWFDRASFLDETRRVLRKSGKLVVYDNYFSGNAIETDELSKWVFESYRSVYPPPPRAAVSFALDSIEGGFRCIHREDYENAVSFTQESLVDYLSTQTNVIAAVEEGGLSVDDVKERLQSDLQPFFTQQALTIRFGGPIWILESVTQR
jgi:ubiquinone/menaquinone biosynthesis C-methylase UbiE